MVKYPVTISMLPTCSDDFPENSLIKSHTVTILNPESGYLFVLLSISIRVSIHETPSAVSRQATKPFVTLRREFYYILPIGVMGLCREISIRLLLRDVANQKIIDIPRF